MKKTIYGIHIFQVIAVSLLILALPAYLHYTQLSQIKFVSSDLCFENPDQEGGLADNEKELKVHGSSAFLIISLLSTNLFEHSFLFSQVLSSRHKIVILRC